MPTLEEIQEDLREKSAILSILIPQEEPAYIEDATKWLKSFEGDYRKALVGAGRIKSDDHQWFRNTPLSSDHHKICRKLLDLTILA